MGLFSETLKTSGNSIDSKHGAFQLEALFPKHRFLKFLVLPEVDNPRHLAVHISLPSTKAAGDRAHFLTHRRWNTWKQLEQPHMAFWQRTVSQHTIHSYVLLVSCSIRTPANGNESNLQFKHILIDKIKMDWTYVIQPIDVYSQIFPFIPMHVIFFFMNSVHYANA